MLNVDDLFKGRHFDREIIVLCVRWYLRYKLSFRDLVEMMAERGLSLAHTTIMRWIQRYAPEFEKRWNRFARPVGQSWRVDETYVKIKGRWTYLYRAVDKEGKTVDVLLRAKRDVAAAKVFFRRAFRGQGRLPHKITLDGYQASHRAASEVLGEHPEGNRCEIRSSKYLNNLIERITDRSSCGSVRCSASSVFGELQRRSPASNSCTGSERVSSNSANFASKTKPRLRFGMQCLARDPRQAPERFLAPISSICTTAYFGTSNGSVYASRDEGKTWECIARDLPAISSVETMTAA
jgi:transposase-like protein